MPSYRKFTESDVIRNRIKTFPQVEFYINDRKVYFNKKRQQSGSFVNNVCHVDTGYISLYEENVDRPSTSLVYPYITKRGSLDAFKTITTSEFNSDFAYGDIISSSYPLDATISVDRFPATYARPMINALENTLDYYKCLSPHYAYSSSFGDKSTDKISLISVPSIFYGSSIRKGSVDLKFYVSGTMIGRLQDARKNGELIQTEPSGSVGSGSIAGVCLYTEGFMLLTGAWNITQEHDDVYIPGDPATFPQWYYFASTGSSAANANIPSSSFEIKFDGVNYVDTLTMFCHANPGECNFSNNPTWKEKTTNTEPITGTYSFAERDNLKIKNIVKSPFTPASASFEKTVFINKILIYDEDRRVIGVAKMSKPIPKKESRGITFKLKVDI